MEWTSSRTTLYAYEYYNTGSCFIIKTWCYCKTFRQWECSFQWKLSCHWLERLRQRQIAVAIQGPYVRSWWRLQSFVSAIYIVLCMNIIDSNVSQCYTLNQLLYFKVHDDQMNKSTLFTVKGLCVLLATVSTYVNTLKPRPNGPLLQTTFAKLISSESESESENVYSIYSQWGVSDYIHRQCSAYARYRRIGCNEIY